MTGQEALRRLTEHHDLSFAEAQDLMALLMLGDVADGLVGGLLTALLMKGVTGDELAGFASTMRSRAIKLEHDIPGVLDTCGTGGGPATFNLSTAAAVIAAAAGAKVAKHGNRSVTSTCGSADVLEHLGVKLTDDQAVLHKCLQQAGIAFMFAPQHHAATRHVSGVRKALGLRTVFNLLGPLSNPAGAKRQLIGIFDDKYLGAVADALVKLGSEKCYVVHGADGLDEVSPCGPTRFIEASSEGVREGVWRPADFGLDAVAPADLAQGSTVAEASVHFLEAISNPDSRRCTAVLPNAAVVLWLAGRADSLPDAAGLARAAVAEGRAVAKLEELRELSRS